VQRQAQAWRAGLAWAALAVLLAFQTWAYYARLPLFLGPRFVLEPWLLRRGFVLYENLPDIHTPLLPLLLAGLAPLVPDAVQRARLLLVALLALTTLLAYLLGARKIGRLGGLGMAVFFAGWSAVYDAGILWYETLLAPLYLLWLLGYQPPDRPRAPGVLLRLGLLGGAAVLVKQHAAVPFLALLLWDAGVQFRARAAWSAIGRDLALVSLCEGMPVASIFHWQWAQAGTVSG